MSVSKTFCFTVVLRLVVQLECPVVDAEVVGAEEELGGGLDGAQRQGHGDAKDNSPQKCYGGLEGVGGRPQKTNSEEGGKHSENGGERKERRGRSGNYSLSVGG